MTPASGHVRTGGGAPPQGRKPKLYCKVFADTGKCDDDKCTAVNHWSAEKVAQAKVLYGDDLRGYYQAAKK